MKICLAFTPLVYSEPPVGIALLKAYLQERLPSVAVGTFDLNLRFFQRLRERGAPVSCIGCPSRDTACRPPQSLVPDADLPALFRSLRDTDAFENSDPRLPGDLFLFQEYLRSLRTCFEHRLRHGLEHGEPPESLRAFLEEDAGLLLSQQPGAVGFSVLTTNNLPYALALARVIKMRSPVPVLLGGPAMTHMDPGEILRGCDFIDYIVQGEGEEALRVFLEQFPRVRPERVPNLAYRDGDEIRCNEQAFVAELDKLPFPDFSDYELNEYLMPGKFLLVSTSRGCYWGKCAFCVHYKSYARGMRAKSVERFVDELEFYGRRYGITRFFITDDMLAPQRLAAISDEITRRRLAVRLGLHLRPERGMTYDILKKAFNAGFSWILWGVESLTQRVLDAVGKGTRVEEVAGVVRHCRKAGIKAYLSIIAGLPPVTEEEYRRELELLEDLVAQPIVRFSRLDLYLDSLMARDPARFGITRVARKPYLRIRGTVIHRPDCDYAAEGPSAGSAVRQAWEALPDRIQALYQGYDFLLSTGNYPGEDLGKDRLFERVLAQVRGSAGVRVPAGGKDPFRLYLAGLSAYLAERPERALSCFEAALRPAGEAGFRRRLAYYAGLCQRDLGQFERARDSFSEALAGFPGHPAVLSELAGVYHHLGEYRKAAAAIEPVMDLCAGDAEMRCLLGICYGASGAYERAVAELVAAERLAPRLPGISFLLAEYYRKSGRHAESLRAMAAGHVKWRKYRPGDAKPVPAADDFLLRGPARSGRYFID